MLGWVVDYPGNMKKLLRTLMAILAVLGFSVAAKAADDVVMLELFTSQGCSSCPPADANLGKLSKRDDVIALSMHVDYWDYLGWRDTFAKREHTQRQVAYRDAMGARVIYTPQMVVQGRFDVPGYRPDQIEEAIGAAYRLPRLANISIQRADGMLKAIVTSRGEMSECTIWVASYDRSATVEIARGENAGEQITYHNIVDKLMRVGSRKSHAPQEVALPQPDPGTGVAIWLQDVETQRIISASFING